MVDFSLLQQPNFAQAALSGYQAGSALAKQKQVDAALSGADLSRPETLMPVLRADPSTGAALIGASAKMAEYKHDLAGRAAMGDYLAARMGMPSGGAALTGAAFSPPAAPNPATNTGSTGAPLPISTAALPSTSSGATTPSPSTLAAPDPSADIVVTAQRPVQAAAQPQPSALDVARANFIRSDPEGYLKVEQQFATMTNAQRAVIDDTTSAFDGALQGLKTIPESNMAARQAYIQSHRENWIANGIPAANIDGFVPTDANIADQDNRVLGIKGILDRQDKDRTFAQTVRHQGVEEAQGAQRIGLEGQNVAISAGHLALDRNADARAASAASDKTAAKTPAPHYEYRIVNGVTQRRIVE